MPNESEKRTTLDVLEELIPTLQIQFDLQQMMAQSEALERNVALDSDSEVESDEDAEGEEVERSAVLAGYATIHDLDDMRLRISNARYLMERRSGRGLRQLRGPHLENLFHMDENWFRAEFRVGHAGFAHLHSMIKDDEVFRNDSRNPQAPVEYQLAVALSRLGHSGNRISARAIASGFLVAEGTAVLWTRRVIVALLAQQERWIRWPDNASRQQIKTRIGKRSAFAHCIGFVDGTHIPLDIIPSYQTHSDFYGRKAYALNCLFICDDENRITFMSLGWGGSAHDARVWRNSSINLRPEEYFDGDEYILGDSAYTPSKTVIPAYKENVNPRPWIPLNDRKRFNIEISRQRVAVEHTIGMLKARFQSLRGMRHMIKDKRSFGFVLCHIRACVILHNMMIGLPSEDFWDQDDLPRLREEWEREAAELRQLMNGEAEPAEGVIRPREPGEQMREALRYRFQVTGYGRPYAEDEDSF